MIENLLQRRAQLLLLLKKYESSAFNSYRTQAKITQVKREIKKVEEHIKDTIDNDS